MGVFSFDFATAGRRAVMKGIGSLVLTGGSAQAASGNGPRVLFVCQYGSVKSPIAREILGRRARERKITVSTFSRGITPEAHLPPAIGARLRAEGIDPAREGLHRLLPVDLQAADIVVFFNPLPSALRGPQSMDWTSVPSVIEAYPMAMTDIRQRVEQLLDTIPR